jgi:hypothetical protein
VAEVLALGDFDKQSDVVKLDIHGGSHDLIPFLGGFI